MTAQLTLPRLTEAYDLLYQLGITANYKGFFYITYGILLTLQNPDRVLMASKWLYPMIAKHYGTNWHTVERDIRTVIAVIWNESPNVLFIMMGGNSISKPTPSRFISAAAAYLQRAGRAA